MIGCAFELSTRTPSTSYPNNITKSEGILMKAQTLSRLIMATFLTTSVLIFGDTSAQVPARFYLKSLSDANAVPLIVESINSNSNPFDPAHIVSPGANFSATMGMFGYARTFSMFDRSATAAVIFPMGRVSGDVTLAGRSFSQSANGFGDPLLEFSINFIGPSAQKNIPDTLRYQPGFSMDLLLDIALPIGEYDSSRQLNLGQNRLYGRVGLPTTIQLGPWIPGRRTTLEFVPSVWMFGTNNNYLGQTLKTDPLFQLDAHLTRDFTENIWGSLDATWLNGAKSSINGVSGKSLNSVGLGVTLGYTINDNVALTVGYKSTVNDNSSNSLKMDRFMVSLVFGWHPLVEGAKRLRSQ